jgi:BON domain
MRKLALLAIAAAGAAIAYAYFDRRRAAAFARAPLSPPTDDNVGREVREALSRIVADPHAVHVTVLDGTVTLRGVVDHGLRDRALRAALAVRGVKAVTNRFDTEIPPELRPN